MNEFNETTAWSCFEHTGSVKDYLIYSQCKQMSEQKQEAPHADQYGRLDYHGERRG